MADCLDLETLLNVPFVDPDLGFDISPDCSAHLHPGVAVMCLNGGK